MRLRIKLQGRDTTGFTLPLHYNHLVQGWVYDSISNDLSNFLHDNGFAVEKRKFKLFTFSRLLGKFRISRGSIYFTSPVWIYISTPVNIFMKEFADTLLHNSLVRLGNEHLRVTEVAVLEDPNLNQEINVRMLSPITVYSTLITPDGRKKTYYYSPMEREFSEMLNNNALKKYSILHGRMLKSRLQINPIKVRESIVIYKGTVIKGWMGYFRIRGPKTLMRTVYDSGLGSKNSEGFGMFEVV